MPDDDDDVAQARFAELDGQLGCPATAGRKKRRSPGQIFDRVARKSHLAERNEVGPGVSGTPNGGHNRSGVTFEVTDNRVGLGQR